MSVNANIIEKANIIVNNAEDCYLGLLDENGYPTVSTISSIETDGIFKAYFTTGLSEDKSKRILKNNKASVCYRKDGNNVTLVGTAKVLTDTETKHRLWQNWMIDHFTSGKDDPEYVAIEFTTERVSLWIDQEIAKFKTSDILKVQSRCGLLCNSCEYRETCGCGGCIETNGNPFHGECPIAVCCQNKGYSNCGECENLPCEKLRAYSYDDSEHGDKPAGARVSLLKYWEKYKR